MGINTIEVLPPGEIQLNNDKGFYNTYNGSALSLGTQGINLDILTTEEGNNLLSKQDLMEVVERNTATQKAGFVNYENIIGKDSMQEKALKKAFENFRNRDDIDKTDFETYKKQNEIWLERKAIYSVLKEKNKGKHWSKWEESEKNLFSDFNETKKAKLESIKAEYEKEIDVLLDSILK